MGSEQSTQGSNQHITTRQASLNQSSIRTSSNIRRQHTIANPGNDLHSGEEEGRPGSISPGPSVCSDSELPYISYTVNRPIGDSPKLANKQNSKAKSTPPKKINVIQRNMKKPIHNIVVVNKPNLTGSGIDKDPEILRLQSLPMFLPIMRGTLNLPAVRDPEVLERLDPQPLFNMCQRYQNHLTSCANLIATEQNVITQKVRETDQEITKLVNATIEKQKRFSKYAEKLSKVQELSHYLNKCHMLLNQTLESMETLNNSLDIDDRLEPFVWTTG